MISINVIFLPEMINVYLTQFQHAWYAWLAIWQVMSNIILQERVKNIVYLGGSRVRDSAKIIQLSAFQYSTGSV